MRLAAILAAVAVAVLGALWLVFTFVVKPAGSAATTVPAPASPASSVSPPSDKTAQRIAATADAARAAAEVAGVIGSLFGGSSSTVSV
jgi:hypothetical protein